jgi:hypothetical protein
MEHEEETEERRHQPSSNNHCNVVDDEVGKDEVQTGKTIITLSESKFDGFQNVEQEASPPPAHHADVLTRGDVFALPPRRQVSMATSEDPSDAFHSCRSVDDASSFHTAAPYHHQRSVSFSSNVTNHEDYMSCREGEDNCSIRSSLGNDSFHSAKPFNEQGLKSALHPSKKNTNESTEEAAPTIKQLNVPVDILLRDIQRRKRCKMGLALLCMLCVAASIATAVALLGRNRGRERSRSSAAVLGGTEGDEKETTTSVGQGLASTTVPVATPVSSTPVQTSGNNTVDDTNSFAPSKAPFAGGMIESTSPSPTFRSSGSPSLRSPTHSAGPSLTFPKGSKAPTTSPSLRSFAQLPTTVPSHLKLAPIFHSNPSGVPTNFPDQGYRTKVPVAAPSAVPSPTPTVFCTDLADLTFLTVSGAERDCAWLAVNSKQKNQRYLCQRGGAAVPICRKTCNVCGKR